MAVTTQHKMIKQIAAFAKLKAIMPTAANIAYLRQVGKLCNSIDNNNRGAVSRLQTALQAGLPDASPVALSIFYQGLTPIAKAAVKSACAVLQGINCWLADEDFSMFGMYFNDAADHLNVAKRIVSGASAHAVEHLLYKMDTASRDQMDNTVWRWIETS